MIDFNRKKREKEIISGLIREIREVCDSDGYKEASDFEILEALLRNFVLVVKQHEPQEDVIFSGREENERKGVFS